MKLKNILDKISLEEVYIAEEEEEIEAGYSCDLLSEVIGRAKANSIWVTVHTNLNVIAVSSMIEIKAVIISDGHSVNEVFLNKAKEEGISVLKSNENSFTITGKLYEIGLR